MLVVGCLLIYLIWIASSPIHQIKEDGNLNFHDPEMIFQKKWDHDSAVVIARNGNSREYCLVKLSCFLHIFYSMKSSEAYSFPSKISPNAPFLVISDLNRNRYILCVVTKDPKIKYVSIGTENIQSARQDDSKLSFDQVKKSRAYTVKAVKDCIAVFDGTLDASKNITDQFNAENVVLGFDQNKSLIAERTDTVYGKYVNTSNG